MFMCSFVFVVNTQKVWYYLPCSIPCLRCGNSPWLRLPWNIAFTPPLDHFFSLTRFLFLIPCLVSLYLVRLEIMTPMNLKKGILCVVYLAQRIPLWIMFPIRFKYFVVFLSCDRKFADGNYCIIFTRCLKISFSDPVFPCVLWIRFIMYP